MLRPGTTNICHTAESNARRKSSHPKYRESGPNWQLQSQSPFGEQQGQAAEIVVRLRC
jgi:hypothetical protein